MLPRLELFFSCTDGKLQWEEEAAVNRLQSSEVPVSLEYPTGCGVKGGRSREVLKRDPLPMGLDSRVTFCGLENLVAPAGTVISRE